MGSDDGIRVWVNGKHVHEQRGARPLVMQAGCRWSSRAGDNAVLVKTEQRRGPWAFALRVLEPGTVVAPMVERRRAGRGVERPDALVFRTDVPRPRRAARK